MVRGGIGPRHGSTRGAYRRLNPQISKEIPPKDEAEGEDHDRASDSEASTHSTAR